MSFSGLLVTEIFFSIQGETSHTGLPYIFIRLTGCNLRCSYCDSAYAFHGGTKMSLDEVLQKISEYPTKNVLLTGGEPLLQRGTLPLIQKLNTLGYTVSIETHGEVSIAEASPHARIVMDVKTPGSGMNRGKFIENIPYLKKTDEVKFVITNATDYTWAKKCMDKYKFPCETILFSPAQKAKNSPKVSEEYPIKELAENILKDGLPVRLQYQLHKTIWGAETTGV